MQTGESEQMWSAGAMNNSKVQRITVHCHCETTDWTVLFVRSSELRFSVPYTWRKMDSGKKLDFRTLALCLCSERFCNGSYDV